MKTTHNINLNILNKNIFNDEMTAKHVIPCNSHEKWDQSKGLAKILGATFPVHRPLPLHAPGSLTRGGVMTVCYIFSVRQLIRAIVMGYCWCRVSIVAGL